MQLESVKVRISTIMGAPRISVISLLFLITVVHGFTEQSDYCNTIVEDLSKGIQSFFECSMTNAVPVTLCLNCDKQYDNLTRVYTSLITEQDEKNVSCKSLFFDKDRLGIVQRNYMSAVNLWTGGFCDDCYETPLSVSNDTTEFLALVEQFRDCTKVPTATVCQTCLGIYNQVNDKYERIRKPVKDLVCFDLQEKINQTRRCWSKDVKCNSNPDEKQITFLILTASISALPICFYVLMFAHTHHQDSHEEEQTILNESTAEPEELDSSQDRAI